VAEASRALLCTVNDILDFSKLEAGQVTIERRPTSLRKLARATLDLFTPQAAAKDIDLGLEFIAGAGEATVSVDPDRIRQILLNLVGNAVKFTSAGSVTLKVSHRGKRLRVEVIDTGDGIPPAKQSQLFKRFSQVDGSLTRAHSGTGLGLAICKGLAEAMEGRIGLDSSVGRGSRFWFEIPAQLADAPSAAEAEARAALGDFTGLRVLVADDHAANRELIRLFLSGLGAEISEAVDGDEAVTMAAELPYDVILLDMRMPRMGGIDAAREIRIGGGPNDATPILAFTADVDAERDLANAGFQGVVSKPVEPASLIRAVARATSYDSEPPLSREHPDADAA